MSLPRLAVVTPLPPCPSGIADYALDVAEALAGRFACDFFTDQAEVDEGRLPREARWFAARELPERQAGCAGLVYQLGNSPEHAVVYELLPRLPGLLVLHDLVLHHARARAFLDSPAARAYAARPDSAAHREAALADVARYRDELAYSYPAQAERLLAAQLDTSGALLPYAFPLVRLPAEAARLVAVHNDFAARAVREEAPGAEVLTLPMPARPLPVAAGAAAALRARLGLSAEHVVVGCFGLLTPEKRIETVARALARAATALPSLRLLLVGAAPDPAWLRALMARLGVAERAVVTGRVPLEELGAHLGGRRPGRAPALPHRPRDLGGPAAPAGPGARRGDRRPGAPGRRPGGGGAARRPVGRGGRGHSGPAAAGVAARPARPPGSGRSRLGGPRALVRARG